METNECRTCVCARARREDYVIKGGTDPCFMDGRACEIWMKGESVGVFGVVHPEVLAGVIQPSHRTPTAHQLPANSAVPYAPPFVASVQLRGQGRGKRG